MRLGWTLAVTKSWGLGTQDSGLRTGDLGLEDVGRGDEGTPGRGDAVTRGRLVLWFGLICLLAHFIVKALGTQ